MRRSAAPAASRSNCCEPIMQMCWCKQNVCSYVSGSSVIGSLIGGGGATAIYCITELPYKFPFRVCECSLLIRSPRVRARTVGV